MSDSSKSTSRQPVVRGARACNVCRSAKMKCVGAEDGEKCQRCMRANLECVFVKHRRGRKPGSKLSEASKMLRRLEKGLSNAKLKSQSTESALLSPYPASDSAPAQSDYSHYSGVLRPGDQYCPSDRYASSSGASQANVDDEDEDTDRADERIFPAKLISLENQRNSFFRTILNPEHESPSTSSSRSSRRLPFPSQPLRPAPLPHGLQDPISAGLIDENKAKTLFEVIFIRLNPFINLFDPSLHTVAYVRSKCGFLFTTLIMAGCKFFEPRLYKECNKLANEWAVRAFADAWKRVEVVQAFACLTYWSDQNENRTWTYIGYACRMAVELGLNRYVARPPPQETDFQMRERRNRERTYLILFVHDRSLSTQTGRHWMLPEDDIVRRSVTWYTEGDSSMRCEDVIVSAQVQLRRIAAETTDMFYTNRSLADESHTEINIDVVLKNCNEKLNQWGTYWQGEMQRAGGQPFHSSFLNIFRSYVRLFLNSFGIQSSLGIQAANSHATQPRSNIRTLITCFHSALEVLRLAYKDFRELSVLRYGQETITVMTAYSAIILLKLFGSSNTQGSLPEGAAQQIHTAIANTADAYQDASNNEFTTAGSHARFLRTLLHNNNIFKARTSDRERNDGYIDPRLQGSHVLSSSYHSTGPPPSMYNLPTGQTYDNSYTFTPSPNMSGPSLTANVAHATSSVRGGPANYQSLPASYDNFGIPHATETDADYSRHMFAELGFGMGENGEQPPLFSQDPLRGIPYVNVNSHQNTHYQHIRPLGYGD